MTIDELGSSFSFPDLSLQTVAQLALPPPSFPLALLSALVPLPQATHFQVVLGLDIEEGVVFTPPSVAPAPHAFLGAIESPYGSLSVPIFLAWGSDARTTCWGVPSSQAGQSAEGIHIPLGPYAPKSLTADGSLFYGSSTVSIEGSHAVRLTEVAHLCSPLPIPTPTGIVSAIPFGRPILTGGPTAIDLGALRSAVVNALGSFVAKGILQADGAGGVFLEWGAAAGGLCAEAVDLWFQGDPDAAVAKVKEIFTDAPIAALRKGLGALPAVFLG